MQDILENPKKSLYNISMNFFRRFARALRESIEIVGTWQLSTIAEATAFWFFLSLVPTVTLFASLLPLFSTTQEQVLGYVSILFPSSFNALVEGIIEDIYQSHVAVLSISIAATAWSSAAGFSSLFRGLEEVYGLKHRSGYFLRKAKGILYTVGMIVSLLLSMVLLGFGRSVTDLITAHFPAAVGIFRLLLRVRFVAVFPFLTLFFAVIYKWSTGKPPPFTRTLPGAVLSAAGWIVLSHVISLWVTSFGLYSSYGSLATVAVVMLWLYYCQYILLLGGCVNRALDKTRAKTEET